VSTPRKLSLFFLHCALAALSALRMSWLRSTWRWQGRHSVIDISAVLQKGVPYKKGASLALQVLGLNAVSQQQAYVGQLFRRTQDGGGCSVKYVLDLEEDRWRAA
jgi:hypothetical protein